jgi:hypothetical protein
VALKGHSAPSIFKASFYHYHHSWKPAVFQSYHGAWKGNGVVQVKMPKHHLFLQNSVDFLEQTFLRELKAFLKKLILTIVTNIFVFMER